MPNKRLHRLGALWYTPVHDTFSRKQALAEHKEKPYGFGGLRSAEHYTKHEPGLYHDWVLMRVVSKPYPDPATWRDKLWPWQE